MDLDSNLSVSLVHQSFQTFSVLQAHHLRYSVLKIKDEVSARTLHLQ